MAGMVTGGALRTLPSNLCDGMVRKQTQFSPHTAPCFGRYEMGNLLPIAHSVFAKLVNLRCFPRRLGCGHRFDCNVPWLGSGIAAARIRMTLMIALLPDRTA